MNIKNRYSDTGRYGVPLFAELCVFLGVFFIMLLGLGVIQIVSEDVIAGERTRLLAVSALQGIFVFTMPSLIAARMTSASPMRLISPGGGLQGGYVLGTVMLLALMLPALNQLIFWNESVSFPVSMKGLESTLRGWENANQNVSRIILAENSVGGMICGVLVIGVITGIGEEFFFRGGLQRLFGRVMPAHIAVWVAALIFSVMHFQFFGLLPRLLLGAVFGYLYLWTGSIWVAVLAHALNNSLVVLTSWLVARGIVPENIDAFGVAETGVPWLSALSAVATVVFLVYLRKYFFQRN